MIPAFDASSAGLAAQALAGLLGGAALGLAFFSSLWWTARLLAERALLPFFGLSIVRFGVLAAGLWVLLQLGLVALLAAALGLLVGRWLVLRRVRGELR